MAVTDIIARASQATGRELATLPESTQVEYIERLSRDQIDLALTLRNSHVATLMPHDLVTWARIAERTEVQRDYWKDRAESAETVRAAAVADLRAAERSRRRWRNGCRAACLLALALTLVAVWL